MSSSAFAEFARTAEAVAATTSKLQKRDLLASYLRTLPAQDVPIAATFFAGRPLPGTADKLGLGWVQQSRALAVATAMGSRSSSSRLPFTQPAPPGLVLVHASASRSRRASRSTG